jgi:hypothetical protein
MIDFEWLGFYGKTWVRRRSSFRIGEAYSQGLKPKATSLGYLRCDGNGNNNNNGNRSISRFGFAFTPAFGRAVTALRWSFRCGAKAPLYLRSNGKNNNNGE